MTTLQNVRKMLPKLDYFMRKGACGRIGVIGGSVEYTGAPFFAAISALKLGADLVHIFCPTEAATVIKGYSPELMVHPGFDDHEALISALDRLDALVLGPGLGRDPRRLPLVQNVLTFAQKRRLPTVIDADGLWFLKDCLEQFRGADSFFLTPNLYEFHRLVEKSTGSSDIDRYQDPAYTQEKALAFSKASGMGIYLKNREDLILPAGSSQPTLICQEGMPRRCGGQGDLTSGTLAVFYLWGNRTIKSPQEAQLSAGRASHELVRELARRAFDKCGRSTTASDMIEQIGAVLKEVDKEEELRERPRM